VLSQNDVEIIDDDLANEKYRGCMPSLNDTITWALLPDTLFSQ